MTCSLQSSIRGEKPASPRRRGLIQDAGWLLDQPLRADFCSGFPSLSCALAHIQYSTLAEPEYVPDSFSAPFDASSRYLSQLAEPRLLFDAIDSALTSDFQQRSTTLGPPLLFPSYQSLRNLGCVNDDTRHRPPVSGNALPIKHSEAKARQSSRKRGDASWHTSPPSSGAR